MTVAQVEKLALLCPKKVMFCMETSGSISCWTQYGERFFGTKGSDIVAAANKMREKHAECVRYNNTHGWNDHRRAADGYIRCLF